jgi:hypothetical protein
MIWLLTRSVVWPVKTSVGSVKLGYKTGRLFGYKRIFVFVLGVGVGLLLAPVTGAELRERVRRLVEGDLADELAYSESPDGRDEFVDLTAAGTGSPS